MEEINIICKIWLTFVKDMLLYIYDLREVENRSKEGVVNMKNLKLKFARMEKDMSQIDLAKLVGVTRQTIGMIESGDYNPSLNLCISICKVLGKTLDDLFWEENDNEEK